MRAFAMGAFAPTARMLRAAEDWLPEGLDARALRVLGKALSFTSHTGVEELQPAFDRLIDGGDVNEAAVAAIDLPSRTGGTATAAKRRGGRAAP